MKKADTLVAFLKVCCNGIGILQRPWLRLNGSFLPNDTFICKVNFGMFQSLNLLKDLPKLLLY